MRPALLANIVVTGGSSLIVGFNDRLNQELAQIYPGPRIRLQAPGNTVERKYASWIGGSILGSLGSFHQVRLSLGVSIIAMLTTMAALGQQEGIRRTWC